MKNKLGFNLAPAIIAFPVLMGLIKNFNFETYIFEKKALGLIYLVTFIGLMFLTFKKKTEK